jgi:arylsulfatase
MVLDASGVSPKKPEFGHAGRERTMVQSDTGEPIRRMPAKPAANAALIESRDSQGGFMGRTKSFARLTRRALLGAVFAAALTMPAAAAQAASSTPAATPGNGATRTAPPNIIVILADDMGFSDISSFGSEIPTPNIDRLAADGLRFTQFYNTARCSCSRASLMTGTYPHQAGLGHLEPIVVPGSQGLRGKLLDRVVTLGEVLHSAGYFTAMAGKWHMGMTHGVGPWQRGFDRSIASPKGELYFPNQVQKNAQDVYIDGKKVRANSPEVGTGQWYSSNLFVDWAAKFIKEADEADKPFFVYLPFVNAHFPLMAPPEEVARFRGKYMQNWDTLRQARFERQKKLGIVGPDEVLPPRLPNTYNWDRLTPEQRDRFDKIMATYAADITAMDKAIGTLMDRLEASGELDNTLILFMSDNGGNAESGPDGRLKNAEVLGGPKSTTFAGMNWATLQNTPFQYFKHFTEEGGIATPLIAYWPNGIDPKLNGGFVRAPGHLIDIMPTLVEVSGATYPKTFHGHDIVPMQGRSFAASFHGQKLHRDKPIFWEHEGNRAVRDGKWKLVARFGRPWQLYDMSRDRSETRDLAAAKPALVRKMAAQWDAWAAASYVDPWQEAYDIYLGGRPRQNWGFGDIPEHPEAMDEIAPSLRQQLVAHGDGTED